MFIEQKLRMVSWNYRELRYALLKKFIIIIDELSSLAQDEQRMMMKIIQYGLLPDGALLDNDRLWVDSIGNASLLIPELKSYFLI